MFPNVVFALGDQKCRHIWDCSIRGDVVFLWFSLALLSYLYDEYYYWGGDDRLFCCMCKSCQTYQYMYAFWQWDKHLRKHLGDDSGYASQKNCLW